MSMPLIFWIAQSNILNVGISTGTVNILCAIVLLKVGSLDFHIFLTLIKYFLETFSLLTLPRHMFFFLP